MKSMDAQVPQEIYDEILRLATQLKDVAMEGNPETAAAYYEQLKDYCFEQIDQGQEYAFIWEMLGDFTDDMDGALKYYERAMEICQRDGEPDYSVLIAIGERYLDNGQNEMARSYLTAGLKKAFAENDEDMILRADDLLNEMAEGPAAD